MKTRPLLLSVFLTSLIMGLLSSWLDLLPPGICIGAIAGPLIYQQFDKSRSLKVVQGAMIGMLAALLVLIGYIVFSGFTPHSTNLLLDSSLDLDPARTAIVSILYAGVAGLFGARLANPTRQKDKPQLDTYAAPYTQKVINQTAPTSSGNLSTNQIEVDGMTTQTTTNNIPLYGDNASSSGRWQPNIAHGGFIGGIVGLLVAAAAQQAIGLAYLTLWFLDNRSDQTPVGYALIFPLIGALTGACAGFFSAYVSARQGRATKFVDSLLISGMTAGRSSAIAAFVTSSGFWLILAITGGMLSTDHIGELLSGLSMSAGLATGALVIGAIIGSLLSLFGGLTTSQNLRAIWNVIASACAATIGVMLSWAFFIGLGSI